MKKDISLPIADNLTALKGKKVLIVTDIRERAQPHEALFKAQGATVEYEYLPPKNTAKYSQIPEMVQGHGADAALIYRPLVIDALDIQSTEQQVIEVDQTLRAAGTPAVTFDVCDATRKLHERRHRRGDHECAISKALQKGGGVGLGCFSTPENAVHAIANLMAAKEKEGMSEEQKRQPPPRHWKGGGPSR